MSPKPNIATELASTARAHGVRIPSDAPDAVGAALGAALTAPGSSEVLRRVTANTLRNRGYKAPVTLEATGDAVAAAVSVALGLAPSPTASKPRTPADAQATDDDALYRRAWPEPDAEAEAEAMTTDEALYLKAWGAEPSASTPPPRGARRQLSPRG